MYVMVRDYSFNSTHMSCDLIEFCTEFSVMIQKQFFRVFQLFALEVKHFHQKHT